jgi:putative transposase
MGKALAVDLRARAVAAYRRGEGTQAEVARLFDVGEASLRRWLRRDRETGSVAPIVDYRHGPARKIDTVRMDHLESLLGEHADATNEELAELLAERTGLTVSASSISRAVALLGWTRKNSASSPRRPTPRVSAIFVKTGPGGDQP